MLIADLGKTSSWPISNATTASGTASPPSSTSPAGPKRNARYGGEIAGALRDQPVDLGCSIRVAQWAYGQTEAAGGLTWVRREELEPLGAEWRVYLEA